MTHITAEQIMKCDFCKRDEIEIDGIFAPIIMTFEKEIVDLENIINGIKEQYPAKNGFTKENFKKVNKIDKSILEIKLSAIMENMKPFFNLDANIELLTSYFTNYNPKITLQNTLGDLLSLFLNEPTLQRLSDEIKEFIVKKDCLYKKIEKINEKNKFFEVENINDIIIPLNVFGFENEIRNDVLKIIRKTPSIKKKFILCPYCNYLFFEKDICQKNICRIKNKDKIPDNLKQSRGSWIPNPLEE